jgi:flagellin-like hook-associated protein FlgL
VNLQPEDTTTQAVLDRINAAASAAETAGDIPPGSFSAGIALEANGIQFNDNAGGAGQLTIQKQNGSFAAEDLGLLDGTWDAASATLTGADRTSVRVDSAFGSMMALKYALLRNDVRGITFAGERLAEDINRAAQARAIVGGRANRVDVAAQREEDRQLQTISVRSQLRDLDYTEASVRFSLLQTQLQAGLTSVSQTRNASLINFLGG